MSACAGSVQGAAAKRHAPGTRDRLSTTRKPAAELCKPCGATPLTRHEPVLSALQFFIQIYGCAW
jgi:hypothetical protein